MAQDIKQKIVLEGEKEYNAALRDAQRHLKTLRSELKAETAELGKNASAQEKSKVKSENLKKQIQEQEKVVKTLRDALQKAKEQYSDNEEVVSKWEMKLNEARATLATMKDGLEDVGDSMANLGKDAGTAVVATKSVADALGDIGSMGDTVAGAIENVFTGMVSVIRDACGEVWALISETAARADNFGDVAGYWNTDAQTIQRWANAVDGAQDKFDALQNAVSKLVMGDHDKIRDLLGVNYEGDADQWQYAMTVLGNIAEIESTSGKLNILEQLFGEKRATAVLDLLNDWGTITKKVEEWNGDTSGYGMTSEGLETMQDLYIKIGEINTQWQMLKDRVAEGLGTSAMTLAISVDGAMDGLAEFLAADSEHERLAALRKIRQNLEEFFTKLGEIIKMCVGTLNEVGQELQKSDDPITKMIGDILTGLTDALQWMIDNQESVKNAFETIFGVWLLAKLTAVAGKLTSIIAQIAVIQAFKGMGTAGAAASSASAAASGGGSFWGNLLSSTGLKVAGGVGAFLYTLFNPKDTAEASFDSDFGGDQAAYDAAVKANLKYNKEHNIEEDVLLDDDTQMYLSDAIIRAAEDYWDKMREDPFGAGKDVDDAYGYLASLFGPDMQDDFSRLMGLIEDLWTQKEDYPDLPSWWFDNGSGGEGSDAETLSGLKGLPAQISAAAKAGTAQGISGIRVYMDGTAVGHLVAPTVSHDIASWTV